MKSGNVANDQNLLVNEQWIRRKFDFSTPNDCCYNDKGCIIVYVTKGKKIGNVANDKLFLDKVKKGNSLVYILNVICLCKQEYLIYIHNALRKKFGNSANESILLKTKKKR